MLRKRLIRKLAWSIIMLSLINLMASFFHWYTLLWWFDMPMHFLGGLSMLYLSAVLWRPALKWVSKGRYLYEICITALLFSVMWEGLEYYLHVRYGTPEFVLKDALSDILFDLSGVFLGLFVVSGVLKRERK